MNFLKLYDVDVEPFSHFPFSVHIVHILMCVTLSQSVKKSFFNLYALFNTSKFMGKRINNKVLQLVARFVVISYSMMNLNKSLLFRHLIGGHQFDTDVKKLVL